MKILFDNEDADKLNEHKWWISTNGYAMAKIKDKIVTMHKFIMNNEKGTTVDHINRNKLDNRKKNLRIVPQHINSQNMNLKKSNSSGYTGVHWSSERGYWIAQIRINGKKKYLGHFDDPRKANDIYNSELQKYHIKGGYSY